MTPLDPRCHPQAEDTGSAGPQATVMRLHAYMGGATPAGALPSSQAGGSTSSPLKFDEPDGVWCIAGRETTWGRCMSRLGGPLAEPWRALDKGPSGRHKWGTTTPETFWAGAHRRGCSTMALLSNATLIDPAGYQGPPAQSRCALKRWPRRRRSLGRRADGRECPKSAGRSASG